MERFEGTTFHESENFERREVAGNRLAERAGVLEALAEGGGGDDDSGLQAGMMESGDWIIWVDYLAGFYRREILDDVIGVAHLLCRQEAAGNGTLTDDSREATSIVG